MLMFVKYSLESKSTENAVVIDIKKYSFLKRLEDLPFVEGILLFGSRARGDNRMRSDIDLAIICPTATDADWFKVLEIIENADTLLEIDCVRFDKLTDSHLLKKSILDSNVVLYKKN